MEVKCRTLHWSELLGRDRFPSALSCRHVLKYIPWPGRWNRILRVEENEDEKSVLKTGTRRRREIKVRGGNNKSRTSTDSRPKGESFTPPLKKCVPSCSRKQKIRLEWPVLTSHLIPIDGSHVVKIKIYYWHTAKAAACRLPCDPPWYSTPYISTTPMSFLNEI